jgi:uncharacterized protein
MSLQQLLQEDKREQDAMCFVEAHGFLTSLTIQPIKLENEHICAEIFASSNIVSAHSEAVKLTQESITQSLQNGNFPDLPDGSTEQGMDEEELLSTWSAGFMQGVFLQEDAWFSEQAELVAELTLPIISCSGLLDDELDDITQEDELLDAMSDKIPDCVLDLYLSLNTP